MGEHLTNEKSKEKEVLATTEKMETLDTYAIMMVTELANIGHRYLRSAIKDLRSESEKDEKAIPKAMCDHYERLIEDSIPALKRFDGMCKFLMDKAKERNGAGETAMAIEMSEKESNKQAK